MDALTVERTATAKLNQHGYHLIGQIARVPHPTGLPCYLGYCSRKPNPARRVGVEVEAELSGVVPFLVRQCLDQYGNFWTVQTLLVGDNLPIS